MSWYKHVARATPDGQLWLYEKKNDGNPEKNQRNRREDREHPQVPKQRGGESAVPNQK